MCHFVGSAFFLISIITPESIIEKDEEAPNGINIGELLEQLCEAKQLYLQHDLALQQLATAVGTNRTNLGAYFAQQGITYNAYINHLRIEHFVRLYRENKESSQPITAIQLARESGFYSYSTFSAAFKKFMGVTKKRVFLLYFSRFFVSLWPNSNLKDNDSAYETKHHSFHYCHHSDGSLCRTLAPLAADIPFCVLHN